LKRRPIILAGMMMGEEEGVVVYVLEEFTLTRNLLFSL
jgi:hypothetical protein